jgi:short-subunit dehydrogenase
MKKELNNKTALITGATQGLGKEIAIHFVKEGANVILCARDLQKLEDIKSKLKKIQSHSQVILSKVVDVSLEVDIQNLTKFTFDNCKTCEILINNAGIYGPKGKFEEINIKDWLNTIDINFIGSAMLCHYFLPFFKKQNYGKIIQLSGGGATKPMPNISGYAASKAAIVRLIETLAEENKGYNIDINSVAPGSLNTGMLDEILISGSSKVGEEYFTKALKQKADGGESFEKALSLITFLASSKSDGISGKLISAIWDDWERWPKHKKKLLDSDVYTLRRIIGKDRKMNWGDK